jgi:sensor histidine kinase regulating citrate/malate metabolism
MTEKKAFRLASVFAFAGLTALVTLSEQTILVIPDDTLDMWMILSIILIMSILVFNMNHQYEVEKELARLKLDQAELLERDFTTLSNAYTVNAKLFHDFHNHIATLRKLLINKNYAQAIEYLDELQEPVKEITDTIWTGDETIDFLINSKASTATIYQIQLQVKVEFPRHTNIRSTDLCSILGNLLDNALEAAKTIPDPSQRIIWLTIRRINHMLVIKVENNFTQIPINENGNLKTSKEGNGLHGWGLKSAQAAAEKYDGMIRTSYEGGIFRAVATLSYHGISTK